MGKRDSVPVRGERAQETVGGEFGPAAALGKGAGQVSCRTDRQSDT